MKKILMVAAAVCVVAMGAEASRWRPATQQERAFFGATHVADLTYADFASTNLATAETISNVYAIAAGSVVECVVAVLDTAWQAGASTTSDVTLAVGDPDDADYFLTAMQVAEDDTEVLRKWGRAVDDTPSTETFLKTLANTYFEFLTNVTITLQTTTLTNLTGATDVHFEAADLLVVTNATLTQATRPGIGTNVTTSGSGVTSGSFGRKYYSAASKLYFTLTPDPDAPADFTAGAMRLFFRVY